MSSSAPPPWLLSAAAATGQPSRSASCTVAMPTRGFQVFHIDGYSWTKTLPGAERITSAVFTIGGHRWYVDYYPNGTDGGGASDESDSVALYLRMARTSQRVRAEYKFSLLDLAGNAAYELPAETGTFTGWEENGNGCGHAEFVTKVELERRRDSLLRDDCLAIRCDVGVTQVTPAVPVGPINRHGHGHGRPRSRSRSRSSGSLSDDDDLPLLPCRRGGQRQQPLDDKEYIRRCLATKRRRRQ